MGATHGHRNGALSVKSLEITMFRTLAFGLIASATLAIAALAPNAASASGLHIGIGGVGFHSGWHGGYGHHVYGPGVYTSPSLYVGGVDGCMQKRYVETRRGLRARWVNVCN
jgi:uncharacterized membrane protein